MFPYLKYDTFDFEVPTGTEGDVFARYTLKLEEMRQSVKICQAGARAHHADRRLRLRRLPHRAAAQGSGLHGDGSADSALPDVLAGIQRAEGRVLRAGRRTARRTRVLHRLRRRATGRSASSRARRRLWPCQALEKMINGGLDRRRDCRDWFHGRRDGRRRSMSFHPAMDYGRGQHQSARQLPEEGPAFVYTAENRAETRRDLHPVSDRAAQVGHSRRAVHRAAPAGVPDPQRDAARRRRHRLHDGGCRGRRVLLHDVLHASGRQTRPPGLPHVVVRADGRRAGHRRTAPACSASSRARPTRPESFRCSKSSASVRAIARRWSASTTTGTNARRPRTARALIDGLRAQWRASLTGCHLRKEKAVMEPILTRHVKRAGQLHARFLHAARRLRRAAQGARR